MRADDQLCAWDFLPERQLSGPTGTIKQRWARRYQRIRRLFRKTEHEDPTCRAMEELDMVPVGQEIVNHHREKKNSHENEETEIHGDLPRIVPRNGGPSKKRAASFSSQIESIRRIPTQTAGLDAIDIEPGPSLLPTSSANGDGTGSPSKGQYGYHEPATPIPSTHPKRHLGRRILSLAANFITPATIAVLISVPISVIQPLRALFTDTENWTGSRMPNAPDGRPPLGFILDSASFLGQITIPAALVLLGASFARLEIPRKWSDAPIASIVAMTIGKSE